MLQRLANAIYCEGQCNSWLHRSCAGLPKSVFTSLQNSPDPFLCLHCQLKNHTTIISELKATIASLSETITTLQTSVKSLTPASDPITAVNVVVSDGSTTASTHVSEATTYYLQ